MDEHQPIVVDLRGCDAAGFSRTETRLILYCKGKVLGLCSEGFFVYDLTTADCESTSYVAYAHMQSMHQPGPAAKSYGMWTSFLPYLVVKTEVGTGGKKVIQDMTVRPTVESLPRFRTLVRTLFHARVDGGDLEKSLKLLGYTEKTKFVKLYTGGWIITCPGHGGVRERTFSYVLDCLYRILSNNR